MKSAAVFYLAILVVASVPAQNKYPGGIVYGPKAAFSISAPKGWVLDNESGVNQGLPCVLYPKGESWADARTVMYAKIASTQYEDAEKFAAVAIKEMGSKHGEPKEKIDKGKTGNGQAFFINEYPATKMYSQWERVGVHPIAEGGGLHRSFIARRSELSQRCAGAARSVEDVSLPRAED